MLDSWWVTDVLNLENGQVRLFSWVFWVIGSIVLHELAHGWAAIWEGDDTPIVTGHVKTWNPMVHMGGMSLLLFAVVGFAFGAMPVNPYAFRHRRWGHAIVAFAGPAMNLGLLLVAAGLFIVAARFGAESQFLDNSLIFLSTGVYLNSALFLLNMIPVFPLDGSKILGGFIPAYDRFIHRPDIQHGSGILVLVAIVMLSGPITDAASAVTRFVLSPAYG